MMSHLAGSFWFGISQEVHSAGGWGHFKDFFSQVSGAGLGRTESPGDGIVGTTPVSLSFHGLST